MEISLKNRLYIRKRRRKEAAGSTVELEDRISQLPQHILQNHILSLLPQEDAVRTCLLSKSWRHLGPTRPKLEFHESFFRGNKHKFQFVVENTLQRYIDQNLPLHEFVLGYNKNLYPYQYNWIPIVIKKMGVKLQMLKRLSLHEVYIEDETFENIMSCCCPLIEHLVLDECHWLTTVKVNKARNLKHLFYRKGTHKIDSIEMDDAPSLETIQIIGSELKTWFILHNNYFFPRLKSLYLYNVHLPTELLDNLSSNNCPCLEELQLHFCSGFTEFMLSNRSIKRLIITIHGRPIKADIDAANMLYSEFSTSLKYLPSISFATTPRECKSEIDVWRSSADSNAEFLTWYRKLHEFLKTLSQTQISLDISCLPLTTSYDGGSCEPVVVELLWLAAHKYSSSEIPDFLNCLFRTCRPRYIDLFLSAASSYETFERVESLWKALARKGKKRQCHFWKQDLEESSIQVLDMNTNEWRSVQVRALPYKERVRFRLKWRDLS